MPPEDKNKLNRLEDLKSKLASNTYKTEIEHHDTFSSIPREEVKESWADSGETALKKSEEFFMKTSKFKKFFIFSVIFFALTLMYASFVFFAGGNIVSNDNIEITVVGNNFTGGGEELPLVIGIANKNATALDLVDLVIEYPKGSAIGSAGDTAYYRQSLGTIPAGASRNENVKVVLFGEQGTVRTIKISIEYRVAGSSAIFIKEKKHEVNITSTPINLSVDAPTSLSPNQDMTLTIKETLNAANPAEKVLLKVAYPVGFKFENSVPMPSFGNNVWNLGDLAPGAEREIVISGKMVDVYDGEEKTFNISTGTQSNIDKTALSSVFNAIRHTVMIKRPFVETNLFINGVPQREYAIDSKEPIDAEIKYANNLDTKINDLVITAKISGNGFNKRNVQTNTGFYDSAKNLITWDKNIISSLREVNPGEYDSVSFTIFPLPLYSATSGLLENPTINIDVDISGKQVGGDNLANELNNGAEATIKLSTDLDFSAKALYYSGPFENTGPIPPKAETATTYTIVWTISNTANNVSNAQISASLPAWVNYLGKVSPSSETVTYNNSTKKVIWNAGRVPKGAGTTAASRSVAFQISLTPSATQAGSVPLLITNSLLTAHDDFANVDLRVTKPGLTTKTDDPSMPPSGAVVSP